MPEPEYQDTEFLNQIEPSRLISHHSAGARTPGISIRIRITSSYPTDVWKSSLGMLRPILGQLERSTFKTQHNIQLAIARHMRYVTRTALVNPYELCILQRTLTKMFDLELVCRFWYQCAVLYRVKGSTRQNCITSRFKYRMK